jgi:hypothetical protein
LEDTLQSLVEGGNASALPYPPPTQTYTTLFDGDEWDSFGTELPSDFQPEINGDAQNYSQGPDNNILPSVITPAQQESPPNSIISKESHIHHIPDQTTVSTNAEGKDTLYGTYMRLTLHSQADQKQIAPIFRAYSTRLPDVP